MRRNRPKVCPNDFHRCGSHLPFITLFNFFFSRQSEKVGGRKKITMLVQNFGALRQFVPAELKHNSKGWYIEYYKLNPIVQDLERVRLMMNRERKRCKSLTEFKLQANAIILQINNQLAAGFINLQQNIPAYGIGTQESYTGDNVRFYTPLEQVIDLYEKDRCSGVSTSALPAKASRNAIAGTHCRLHKSHVRTISFSFC